MNKISKAKKQQIGLVLAGVAAVVAGLWYLVIQTQYSSLAGVQQKTLEMKDKVANAEHLLKRAGEIEATLDAETKSLETIEEGMASGDVYLWFINTINRFNATRQVSILDFQRELIGNVGVLPKFPYSAATFPVKGVSHYSELGKFLAEFENSFPYARVQNLELAPATKAIGDEVEQLNFKFEIVALIRPTGQ